MRYDPSYYPIISSTWVNLYLSPNWLFESSSQGDFIREQKAGQTATILTSYLVWTFVVPSPPVVVVGQSGLHGL